MNWLPIEQLEQYIKGRKMFVAKAFNVDVGSFSPYTTDPYCVWVNPDGHFARWPHSYDPTHFCLLPEDAP